MTALTNPPHIDLWVDITTPLTVTAEVPNPAIWESWFSLWLTALNPNLSTINQYEVSLLLTDDAHIQQLNATYRQQDRATDVLAFAAQEINLPGAQAIYATNPLPLGDIIISVETAQRQRHDVNYSLQQELAWLAAHGLLHLLGWDHPDDPSLQVMLKQQERMLEQIRLSA